MKDKNWLKEELLRDLMQFNGNPNMADYEIGIAAGIRTAINLIEKLDEQELTQRQVDKWLDDRDMVAVDTMMVHQTGMQNKVVVEKPVIPQFVADWIERCKEAKHNLYGVLDFAPTKVEQWIFQTHKKSERVDLVAHAWLDGYEVEKEPHYYVAFKEFNLLYVTHVDIYGENGKFNYTSESDKNHALKFTDKSRAKYLADFLGAIVVEVTE